MLKYEDETIRKLSKAGRYYRDIAKAIGHDHTGVFRYMMEKGISLNLENTTGRPRGKNKRSKV